MTKYSKAEEFANLLSSTRFLANRVEAIINHDDEIRRECADRVMFITGRIIGKSLYLHFDSVIAAIMEGSEG